MEQSKREREREIQHLKFTDEHPRPFYMGVPQLYMRLLSVSKQRWKIYRSSKTIQVNSNAIHKFWSDLLRQRHPNTPAVKPKGTFDCLSYGTPGHPRSQCKYRNFSCHTCGKNAYISATCKSKPVKWKEPDSPQFVGPDSSVDPFSFPFAQRNEYDQAWHWDPCEH